MIDKEKIHELANLARISMTEDEEQALTTEVESILDFVKNIQEASTLEDDSSSNNTPLNVMREDNNEHEKSLHTEDLLREAPMREGNYLRVKKIL